MSLPIVERLRFGLPFINSGNHAELLEVADTIEELRDKVIAAYIAGATDVHNNWQEDRDPDFTEAAHDYADAALAKIGATP